MQNPKFSDTHCIKVDFDKEVREQMTEEEKKAQPIIGGLRELERKQEQMPVTGYVSADNDDLPF